MNLKFVQQFGSVRLLGQPKVGRRRFGVPIGGAFDQESLALANALVARDAGSLAYELGMAYVEISVGAPGLIAVVGAVAEVSLNAKMDASNRSFAVAEGDVLTIRPPSRGSRVYVAWGSGCEMSLADIPRSLHGGPLPTLPGPQEAQVPTLFGAHVLSVSQQSDRVGIRVDGFSGHHSLEIPSEPQCPGVVQATPDGTLIVLGPDGPTIGGYPKPAVVASAALDRVGQLRPGDEVSFQQISIEDALEQLAHRKARIADALNSLRLAHQARY